MIESKYESSQGARHLHSSKRKSKGGGNEKNMRKDTLKEIRRSITRARDEHRKNLNEISRINESVKYSPRGSTQFDLNNLNQASIDETEVDGDKIDQNILDSAGDADYDDHVR